MDYDEVEKLKVKYRKALCTIAEYFEDCDISDSVSDRFVLRVATTALGWSAEHDESGQVKLDRG